MDSSDDVECKAVDSSGFLGFFYDKRKDVVLNKCDGNLNRQSFPLSETARCDLISGSSDTNFNLLQFIAIQDELSLNLLLKITRRVGIAAVTNYTRYIDEWTRILYYSYIDQKEQIDNTADISKLLILSALHRDATHIISAVDFGIDLVAILQLPSEPNITIEIDNILQKIRSALSSRDNTILLLTPKEKDLLEKVTNTTVYSNTPALTSVIRVSDILDQINRIKKSFNYNCPVTYYLQPITQFHALYTTTSIAISPTLINKIVQYLIQLRTSLAYLKETLQYHEPRFLYGYFQDTIYTAHQQCTTLENNYTKIINKFSDLVIGVRSSQFDVSTLSEMLSDKEVLTLQNNINKLTQYACDLQQQQSNYNKPVEQQLKEDDSTRITEYISERYDQQNETKINYDENHQSIQRIPSIDDISPISILSTPSSSITDEIINIILLGETGVGKSTFINAFVNYLSFDTFEQAELNKPIVLIPVSFLMTVGDDFEEQIIKFGDKNNSKNEDFNHPGQSVTQHCKSYIFHLHDGKKLRIIDTPGFGDTRGLDYDDYNMQNILEYITNLTHINAVCFLLKPNISRLNIFFRSCLIQLFDLLGPNIRKNLIFCFTNTRATFYNPGDTAPLLKKILKSFSTDDILFKKESTFCFDSESFRYLVALRNEISFEEDNRLEYEMSWLKSVKESNHLIDYIRTKLTVYYMQGEWQSVKHAQFEIIPMIRPILETIRNILRNIILWKISDKTIELYPSVIYRSASLCRLCTQKTIQIDNFWIIEDSPHEFQNTCLNCSCSSDHHIRIDYILGYKSIKNSMKYPQDKIDNILEQLCHASAMFAYFLIYIAYCIKEDPFESGLDRMIFQENAICTHQNPHDLNLLLVNDLMKLRREHEQKINNIKLNENHISLSVLYNLMHTICKYPMVQEQMAAIKQRREIIMKQHENEYQEI